MSRKNRMRNRNNKKNEEKIENSEKDRENYTTYEIINKTNALFEAYYKQLGLIKNEEWESFMNVLGQTLLVTFRITSYKKYFCFIPPFKNTVYHMALF
jgi:hypothetical protein